MPKPDPCKTLEFLSELSPKSVYSVDAVSNQLMACGFFVEKVAKITGVTVNGIRIRQVVPTSVSLELLRTTSSTPPFTFLLAKGLNQIV